MHFINKQVPLCVLEAIVLVYTTYVLWGYLTR